MIWLCNTTLFTYYFNNMHKFYIRKFFYKLNYCYCLYYYHSTTGVPSSVRKIYWYTQCTTIRYCDIWHYLVGFITGKRGVTLFVYWINRLNIIERASEYSFTQQTSALQYQWGSYYDICTSRFHNCLLYYRYRYYYSTQRETQDSTC